MSTLLPMFAELLQLGGPVALLLAVMSITSVAIALYKWMQFARLRINRDAYIDTVLRYWRKGQVQPALDALAGQGEQPVARVVDAAMRGLLSTRAEDTVREEVARIAGNHMARLRTWLRPLELIASLSPLLGLFGTVLGMIEAFRQLEGAGAAVDPALLSGGIWQALLTTAIGLAVAIPALLLHQWFDSRIERCGRSMEDAVTRVFTQRHGDTDA